MKKKGHRKTIPESLKDILVRKETLLILLIFSIALILRIIYLNQISDNPYFYHPIVDCSTFHKFAKMIFEGTPPTRSAYFQAPLYYYFLAFIYRFVGVNLFNIRVVQFIIGAINCVLTYYLGKRIFGKWIGFSAGLIMAFYGTAIFFEGEILRPVLIIFLNLLLLLMLLKSIDSRKKLHFFISGILLGLSAIAKPTILLFGLFLPVWLFIKFRRGKDKQTIKQLVIWIVLIVIGTIIIITPVTIRNYVYSKQFVLISANYGINLYIGSHPEYDQMVGIRPGYEWDMLNQEAIDAGYDTIPSSQQYFLKKTLTQISKNPSGYIYLLLKKTYLFINGDEIPRNQEIYPFRDYSSLLKILLWKYGIAFPYGIIFPLGITGIILALFKRKDISLLILFIATHIVSIVVFFVCARYRLPIIPLLSILGVFAVSTLINTFREQKWKIFITGIVVLAGLLFASNYRVGEMSTEFTADSYYNLGAQLEKEGDIEEAEKLFRKAIELKPDYPEANGYLGLILDFKGEYDEALSRYKIVLDSYPDYVKVILNMGNLYFKMGEYDKAKQQYLRVLELEPNSAEAKDNLQQLELKIREKEIEMENEEIQKLLKELPENENNPAFLNKLGIAYLNAGLNKRASEYFALAILLAPEFPQFHNNLGIALAELGEYDKAMMEFRTVLKYDPDNQSAMKNIEKLKFIMANQ